MTSILQIKEKLAEIDENGVALPDHFTSISFQPALDKHELHEMEREFGISLPNDFKVFLTQIGNGGFGPGKGVISFGLESFVDPRVPVSLPHVINSKKEFPYHKAWNFEPLREAMEAHAPNKDDLMAFYFSIERINGAIRIFDWGGGGIGILVVNGDEYGKVWSDYRPDFGGVTPEIRLKEGTHMSFLEFYNAWLEEIRLEIPLDERRFW